MCKLPLTDREIPIVADYYVDKEFGTGAVKITPAHDPNDFEVGKRHNLPEINIMNDDATINEQYGGKYAGMDRYEARKAMVADLEEQGYLVKVVPHSHNVGTHDRCHTTVEPMIKQQWFVKMEDLAKPAIEAIKNGDLRFVPERFNKIYLHWLENIRDWCISRQIWWGHRIPAYYCDECGEVVVGHGAPEKCPKCGCTHFTQDEDTLDTWFSSALWPFSTLGWPDKTEAHSLFPCMLGMVILCVIFTGCTLARIKEPLTMTGTYFDTVIQLQVWDADEEILEHCKNLCRKYENLFSAEVESSDIGRINQAEGKPVSVSSETAELIQLGIHYGELSDGKFDITVLSASELWDFHDGKKVIPDQKVLEEAVSHIDYKNIQVDGTTVTMKDPKCRIDLGGIAKGYIADRLKEYLEKEGIEHATINLGGNVLTIGTKPDGSDYKIGIQKPFAADGEVLEVLSVHDRSVVSSGDYERYFEKDGVIYHHILDPQSGWPVQNDLDQVTILSDSSADGDALSTTCYVLGLEKGMKLIQEMDDVEAIFVTKEGEIYRSY